MYRSLRQPETDAIVELARAFRADNRVEKIDLGIGVYRDERGLTPVMRAVKAAERKLVGEEVSKAYMGFAGNERFNTAMIDLVLGGSVQPDRVRGVQTPGGGGAVRLIAELIRIASPESTVWVSEPTWINHRPILQFVGLSNQSYSYFDRQRQAVGFDRLMDELGEAKRGDVILLHGCCHNPTGADFSPEEWSALADLAERRGLIPFFDIAYQGFGDGLDKDVEAARLFLSRVPEGLVAVSCSKNFGVYCDRVGCAIVVAENGADADRGKATFASLARLNYSFPPNHGAAVVCSILESPQLMEDWASELETMRMRIANNRHSLAAALRSQLDSDRFDFIARQRGMFSLLGLTPSAAAALRERHALFLPNDGRINLAGLHGNQTQRLAGALQMILAGERTPGLGQCQ